MKIVKKYVLPLLVVLGILGIDQLSKFMAIQNLPYRQEVVVLDGIFSLFRLNNTGMAFGLLEGQRWLLAVMTVVILGFLAFFYTVLPQNKVGKAYRFTILMLAGGALGNLVDRLFRETGVVDFFMITAFDGFFPWVFNVADVFVVVPVIVMAVLTFFLKEEDMKKMKWKRKKDV
ncbi:MAG: signal peptidase II [Defluviitaleaceae bacterium]|nr:signal peptidase II [Defluviitaleaceae bacterium]